MRVAVGLSLDLAFEESGLFILTMHPCVIGHRSRIATLGRLIDHRQAMPGVWFAPHEQNARHEKAAAGGLSRD